MNKDYTKYCRLDDDGYVEFPPHWDPEEQNIMNPHLNDDYLARHGYEEHTQEWIDEHQRPAPAPTVNDYDQAMEDHLKSELVARGYTTHSPIEYTNSTVPRWKQDAVDWQAHLDEVMLYGLEIMNKYEAGEEVPTLEEFREALPRITWTVALA